MVVTIQHLHITPCIFYIHLYSFRYRLWRYRISSLRVRLEKNNIENIYHQVIIKDSGCLPD